MLSLYIKSVIIKKNIELRGVCKYEVIYEKVVETHKNEMLVHYLISV